jgi:hypothetical protein
VACWGFAGYIGSSPVGAGSPGVSDAHAVLPSRISDTDYRFKMAACHLVMDVNPRIGARVSALTIGGTNVVTRYACAAGTYDGTAACNNSGSTFWTSPQSAWPSGTWPPVASIDGHAYTPNVRGSHLLMTGGQNAALGARVEKDFSADDKSCSIAQRYSVTASRAMVAAPWEITRVPRGGIAFFPQGERTRLAAVPAGGAKLIADGTGGWLAYALGDVLFIKHFTDVPPGSFAPGEGDIEIYAGSDYLELEVQGAYTHLSKGKSTPWMVRWRAVAIPSTVSVAAGSATLLTFAQQHAN